MPANKRDMGMVFCGDVVVAQIPSAEVARLVPGTQVRLRVRPVPALAINPAD